MCLRNYKRKKDSDKKLIHVVIETNRIINFNATSHTFRSVHTIIFASHLHTEIKNKQNKKNLVTVRFPADTILHLLHKRSTTILHRARFTVNFSQLAPRRSRKFQHREKERGATRAAAAASEKCRAPLGNRS